MGWRITTSGVRNLTRSGQSWPPRRRDSLRTTTGHAHRATFRFSLSPSHPTGYVVNRSPMLLRHETKVPALLRTEGLRETVATTCGATLGCSTLAPCGQSH